MLLASLPVRLKSQVTVNGPPVNVMVLFAVAVMEPPGTDIVAADAALAQQSREAAAITPSTVLRMLIPFCNVN
jgi:hypothetical protein